VACFDAALTTGYEIRYFNLRLSLYPAAHGVESFRRKEILKEFAQKAGIAQSVLTKLEKSISKFDYYLEQRVKIEQSFFVSKKSISKGTKWK